MKPCMMCDSLIKNARKKFCSLTCKRKHDNSKYQNYTAQKRRGMARKAEALKLLGSKCSNKSCGYNKNIAALCFHHIDESTKLFELDLRAFSNSSPELLHDEIKKCILLCHNCHMELHYPQYNNIDLDDVIFDYKSMVMIGNKSPPTAKTKKQKFLWPSVSELQELLSNNTYEAAARKLGVSSNAIRKHLRKHLVSGVGIEPTTVTL